MPVLLTELLQVFSSAFYRVTGYFNTIWYLKLSQAKSGLACFTLGFEKEAPFASGEADFDPPCIVRVQVDETRNLFLKFDHHPQIGMPTRSKT